MPENVFPGARCKEIFRLLSETSLRANSYCATFFMDFTDSQIKEKIVNFKNISKSCCHKNEVGQNNWQRMGLFFFIL